MTPNSKSAPNRRFLYLLPLVLLAVVACTDDTTNTTSGPTADGGEPVVMENIAFQPDEITVAVGTTVTWTNQDGVTHTTTSNDDLWDSERLSQGDTFSFTFDEAGTFEYICTIHPGQMQATVTVEG